MVEEVNYTAMLSLRSSVLYVGKRTLAACIYPTDILSGTLHLGVYNHSDLSSIGSFHYENLKGREGIGIRLRGMATDPELRGRNLGRMILGFAASYFAQKEVAYIWCNARKVAYDFYQKNGYEFVSAEFELPEIGTHRQMLLNLI